MFVEQAAKPSNPFWKYILGFFITIIAMFMGQIPYAIAIAVKVMTSGETLPTTEEGMLRYLDLNLGLFLLLLSFAVGLLGLFIIVRSLHNQKFRQIITSRQKVDWRRFFFAFVVWGIFSAGSTLLFYFLEPKNYVLQFNLVPFLILAAIAIVMIPLQTSFEELLFRGYLMQGIGVAVKNKWLPLVITSVLFGVLHLANPEVDKMGPIIGFYYIGTGLLLGIMTLMDEGTELSLGFHAANNLIAALLVTADWTAFQTHSVFKDISEPTASWDIFIPLVVIYPILLFIFAKKYKWHSWKERLAGKVVPLAESNLNSTGNE